MCRHMFPKTLSKNGKTCCGVEDKNNIDVGPTGAQSLNASIMRWQAEYRAQNKEIGDGNENRIT